MPTEMLALTNIPALPVFAPTIAQSVIVEKDAILSGCALIGKVTNANENETAVKALKEIKSLSNRLERQRKEITEPFIEAQRAIKRTVDEQRDELDREAGRIEVLCKEFAFAEQKRIRDEEEAQRRELARIEREKEAELARIREEQEKAEREAREAREAAECQARDATNPAQREAAAKAFAESEAKRKEAEKLAAEADANTKRVEEEAAHKAFIEAKPVTAQRAIGQITRKVWRIKSINIHALYRARPDLVTNIEFDKRAITEALNRGDKLPGVEAEEDLAISTRNARQPAAIDV